jgi:hypothetical protein
VYIAEAHDILFARLKLDIATPGLDAHFAEGHYLDQATAAKIPKHMIGRMLGQDEAAKLLARLGS